MAKFTFKYLRDQIGRDVGFVAKDHLSKATLPHSKTLAGTYVVLHKYRQGIQNILVRSPYYWAAIVDQGRNASVARPGRYLVWFKDPKNDPRINKYGYPKRKGSRPKLTRDQYVYWLKENVRLLEAGVDPYDLPMIVTRSSKAVAGKEFTKHKLPQLRRKIAKEVDANVTRFIPKLFNEANNGPAEVRKVTIDI